MRLRQFRKRVGATLTDVAGACGVAPSTIARIEKGATPKVDLALRIQRWVEDAAREARVKRADVPRLGEMAAAAAPEGDGASAI